eukprot:CAMPEP_0184386250 /NCGR_PEP_ID=MMETSP0007-20130409/9625_1 /TAXON_ID=97485 /ORGANISM="Prymnesium parvum, Strain Texoma1" /LENGTH=76 /DNA_ID=CAMNT_0026734027 /DNA_START=471 /DNA_END=699 /DNA_ORIENTATION=+
MWLRRNPPVRRQAPVASALVRISDVEPSARAGLSAPATKPDHRLVVIKRRPPSLLLRVPAPQLLVCHEVRATIAPP